VGAREELGEFAGEGAGSCGAGFGEEGEGAFEQAALGDGRGGRAGGAEAGGETVEEALAASGNSGDRGGQGRAEEAGEVWLVDEEVDGVVQSVAEALRALGARGAGAGEAVEQAGGSVVVGGEQAAGDAVEVAVEGGAGDAGAAGEVGRLDLGVGALGEQLAGGGEQAPALVLGDVAGRQAVVAAGQPVGGERRAFAFPRSAPEVGERRGVELSPRGLGGHGRRASLEDHVSKDKSGVSQVAQAERRAKLAASSRPR
jgi:hypothetical protein